ncbi:hypothetical protein [Candidatus Anaplasma sp. TIGMIC]|uniref:hypothetical protein n=1 Tax=Candidatus Anaplasma sp. TIGMIC TaxID=3020713 RepID=UPI00232E3011|nr:hypothetical protein [Candidatus Anaplasma sp. TIGMIC]
MEEFKKKFTTLDAGTASRALFPSEVRIGYHEGNSVELIPEADFVYRDISTMVSHMVRHGFTFSSEVLSSILSQATALDVGEDRVVLRDEAGPTYVVRVTQDAISLFPVAERYLCGNDAGSSRLESMLSERRAFGRVTVDAAQQAISVTPHDNVCSALQELVGIMVNIGAISDHDRGSVLRQLVELAFRDVACSELRSVRNIASYPQAHPLSKYKDAAQAIESILASLRDGALDSEMVTKLEDAISGRGEFIALPSVLTKGFAKLNKDFGMQMQRIISEHSRRRGTDH